MAIKPNTAILLFVATYFVTCVSGRGIISPRLQKRLIGGGDGSNENVIVSFTQSMDPVFDQIKQQNFTDADEERTAQTQAQQQFTENAQQGLKSVLGAQGVNSQSFWIDNTMYVPNASPDTINTIASFPGVASVEPEEMYSIELPAESKEISNRSMTKQSYRTWGIQRIRADRTWENGYQGRGIVVANIDTGVRASHESLKNNMRSTYNWYDPYRGTRQPDDRQGHGTHVMGTIAGTGGIGVAPQATWIACRGCDTSGCSGSALRSCGQWIQCPTDSSGNNQDCSKAPHVVCNSWGGGQGDTSYSGVVRSWHNAGIIPVFALGNSGPNCGSANSPGDLPNVIGVGNTDRNQRIADSSSLGPTTNGRLKPDVSAPGSDVVSASNSADDRYSSKTGTSMAAPHVTGLVALMKQKRPSANYQQIYDALTNSADSNMDGSTAPSSCGNKPTSQYPNNVFGYGEIDAIWATNAI